LIFSANDVQVGFEMICELGEHCSLFVLTEQSVVYQNATELRSDGLVKQSCGDGTVDAARKSADDPVVSDFLFESLDGVVCKVGKMPMSFAAANGVQKVVQDCRAEWRVGDFRMELEPVDR
jgi:hypothetical protein